MHWAAKYVGLPHVKGARGPKAVDCWGLVCLVYREQFQIILPELPGLDIESMADCHKEIEAAYNGQWEEIVTPFEGCVVGMSQSKAIHHVGLFIVAHGGRILHSDTQMTVATRMPRLRLQGYRTFRYYRHSSWPT